MSAIALYARPGLDLSAKIEAAVERLREASIQHGQGLVQSSSLGVEDMVVTMVDANGQGLPPPRSMNPSAW